MYHPLHEHTRGVHHRRVDLTRFDEVFHLGNRDPPRGRALGDDELLDAMAEHPILIERPFVVTSKGTRLARPVDAVREIL
ncbi:hypothetical protein MGAST_22895 [Mycobacterium gastri 'Wayne']|nr:hypothetical protein MGAST_22895 [Mycobacterium gastri 'Wayne']